MKKVSLLLLCFLLLLSGCTSRPEPRESGVIIREMIRSYGQFPQDKDALKSLQNELEQSDKDKSMVWGQIMDFWQTWDNAPLHENLLPATLPQDNSLCLVVLGFELNPNGTMQEELIGRLQVALSCAQQYPNAYVICTGGGTAQNAPEITEADSMSQWLEEQGLDSSRIIVENRSRTTVENALFSQKLLQAHCPTVRSLAIISSSYHIVWGSVLFESVLLLHQENKDNSIHVVSHGAYPCYNEKYADTRGYLTSQLLSLVE